jgi:hypothetical protein
VIVTSTAEISEVLAVLVVGVTSKLSISSQEVSVELPWQQDGHPRTNLKHPSVAVCNWQATLLVSEIVSLGGIHDCASRMISSGVRG